MRDIIEKNLEAIQSVCKKHFVKELYVFGSVVSDKFNENSDIDFLYKIDIDNFEGWDIGRYDYTDNLLSLEQELQNLLRRKIDLVSLDAFVQNKYMKQTIEQTKRIVYAA